MPRLLVGLMEHAAVLAGDSQLPEGYSTVGISMNVKHLSATPIGLTVRAKAVLTEQDRRKLTFTIRYGMTQVSSEAVHERSSSNQHPLVARQKVN